MKIISYVMVIEWAKKCGQCERALIPILLFIYFASYKLADLSANGL